MILGTPFIGLIQHFIVDSTDIKTNIIGEKIIFEFVYKLIKQNINILQEISTQKRKVYNIIQKKKSFLLFQRCTKITKNTISTSIERNQ